MPLNYLCKIKSIHRTTSSVGDIFIDLPVKSKLSLLFRCLALFGLRGLMKVGGGLNTKYNWQAVLSSADKKLIALARIIYHRPKAAIIDNIFGEINDDIIGTFYEQCHKLGITVISVGNHELLHRYHTKTIDLNACESVSTPM